MASKAKILVVDDDPDFVDFSRIVLETGGYRVLTATSVGEGLALMREAQPDLVLLDAMMSYDFDGLSVVREIKKDPQLMSIPLVLVSAIVSTEDRRFFPEGEDPHHDLFLSKPIEPGDLLKHVFELMQKRRQVSQ